MKIQDGGQSQYGESDRRQYRIVELEGFVVEFRGEGMTVDDVIFHQPNGIFVAQRVE